MSICKVVLLTAMEALRDEHLNKAVSETSEDKTIIDCGTETELRLKYPAIELETPEAWPEKQSRKKKGTSGKLLLWFQVIGEHREYL